MSKPVFVSNELLKARLATLSDDDRRALIECINPKALTIQDALRDVFFAGSNTIINRFRGQGSEPCSYLELLSAITGTGDMYERYCLETIDPYPEVASEFVEPMLEYIDKLESLILSGLFNLMFEKLTSEDRERFLSNLNAMYPTEGPKLSAELAATGGAMALAKAGGFGTYMAMSSLLHTISLGSFSFSAYTTASAYLHLILGPVGWAVLGAVVVNQLGKPDVNRIRLFVVSLILAGKSTQLELADYQNTIHAISNKYPARLAALEALQNARSDQHMGKTLYILSEAPF